MSAFTAKQKSLQVVVDVLRHGRACLATLIGMLLFGWVHISTDLVSLAGINAIAPQFAGYTSLLLNIKIICTWMLIFVMIFASTPKNLAKRFLSPHILTMRKVDEKSLQNLQNRIEIHDFLSNFVQNFNFSSLSKNFVLGYLDFGSVLYRDLCVMHLVILGLPAESSHKRSTPTHAQRRFIQARHPGDLPNARGVHAFLMEHLVPGHACACLHMLQRLKKNFIVFDCFSTNFAPKSKLLLQNRVFVHSAFENFVLGHETWTIVRTPYMVALCVAMKVLIMLIIWGGPSAFHCMLGLNCDNRSSFHYNGKCLLGEQIPSLFQQMPTNEFQEPTPDNGCRYYKTDVPDIEESTAIELKKKMKIAKFDAEIIKFTSKSCIFASKSHDL